MVKLTVVIVVSKTWYLGGPGYVVPSTTCFEQKQAAEKIKSETQCCGQLIVVIDQFCTCKSCGYTWVYTIHLTPL